MATGSPMNAGAGSQRPYREVRAGYDERSVVVYQAYSPEIAENAVAAGTFVPPFRLGRMTWIKPSFLWMAYRSGWATKPGQERVLAIRIRREGFEAALAQACPSHYDPVVHLDENAWRRALSASPVRVQWDPERTLSLEALPWRSIQIGLGATIVPTYVEDWITGLQDVTGTVHAVAAAVREGRTHDARATLPEERPYAVPADVAARIGMVAG